MTPDVSAQSSAHERYTFAVETHELALSLYDYIFPPWRWREWHRRYREVKRRVKVSRAARGAA